MKEIMTRERERKRERPAFFASPPGTGAGTSTLDPRLAPSSG